MSTPVVVGIDVASARPCTCVLVAGGAVQEWLDTRNLDQMGSWILHHRPDVVAVGAPSGLSKGLLLEPESGEKPSSARKCDYELRQSGIPLYEVPREGAQVDDWMQVGLQIYDRLAELGYYLPQEAGVAPCAIEVYPQASFVTLLGPRPPRSGAPSVRPNVLGVLKRNGLSWRDRLDQEALDALVAALTAMRFLEGQVSAVGDVEEALVWVPVKKLEESYSAFPARAGRRRRAELEPMPARLSPERRDELLRSLLVGARRGGDAMIEAFEKSLFSRTGEGVYEKPGGPV